MKRMGDAGGMLYAAIGGGGDEELPDARAAKKP